MDKIPELSIPTASTSPPHRLRPSPGKVVDLTLDDHLTLSDPSPSPSDLPARSADSFTFSPWVVPPQIRTVHTNRRQPTKERAWEEADHVAASRPHAMSRGTPIVLQDPSIKHKSKVDSPYGTQFPSTFGSDSQSNTRPVAGSASSRSFKRALGDASAQPSSQIGQRQRINDLPSFKKQPTVATAVAPEIDEEQRQTQANEAAGATSVLAIKGKGKGKGKGKEVEKESISVKGTGKVKATASAARGGTPKVAKAKKAPGVGAKGSGRGGVNGGKGGKVPPEATATIELGSSDEDDIVDWLDDPVPSSAHNAVASSSRHDPVPKTSPDPLAMPPFSFNLTNQATSNERSIRTAEGVVREQVKKLDARDAASRKTAVSSMKSKSTVRAREGMGEEGSEIPAPTAKSRDSLSTYRTARVPPQGDIVEHPMSPYRLNESFPLHLLDQSFSLILNRTGNSPQWKLHISHTPRDDLSAVVRTEVRLVDVLKIEYCVDLSPYIAIDLKEGATLKAIRDEVAEDLHPEKNTIAFLLNSATVSAPEVSQFIEYLKEFSSKNGESRSSTIGGVGGEHVAKAFDADLRHAQSRLKVTVPLAPSSITRQDKSTPKATVQTTLSLPAVPKGVRKSARQSLAATPPPLPRAASPVGPRIPPERVVLVYPHDAVTGDAVTGAVSVSHGDTKRLDDGEFLNDTLIDYGLKRVMIGIQESDPALFESVHIFNTFFYKKISAKKPSGNDPDVYSSVKRWTTRLNLFKKKYIIVPINENFHWYLAIIVNPGAILNPPRVKTSSAVHRTRASTGGAEPILQLDGSSSHYFAATPDAVVDDVDPMDVDEVPVAVRSAFDDEVAKKEASRSQQVILADAEIDTDADMYAMPPAAINAYPSSLVAHGTDGPDSGDEITTQIPSEVSSSVATPSVVDVEVVAPPAPFVPTLILPSTCPPGGMSPPRQRSPLLDTPDSSVAGAPSREAVDDDAASVRLANQLAGAIDPDLCYIFTFDSLKGQHTTVINKLKKYLVCEAADKLKNTNTAKNDVVGMSATVPLQPNYCDCGLYLLHYVAEFLGDHTNKCLQIIRKLDQKAADIEWKADIAKMSRETMRENVSTASKAYAMVKEPSEKAKKEEKLKKKKDDEAAAAAVSKASTAQARKASTPDVVMAVPRDKGKGKAKDQDIVVQEFIDLSDDESSSPAKSHITSPRRSHTPTVPSTMRLVAPSSLSKLLNLDDFGPSISAEEHFTTTSAAELRQQGKSQSPLPPLLISPTSNVPLADFALSSSSSSFEIQSLPPLPSAQAPRPSTVRSASPSSNVRGSSPKRRKKEPVHVPAAPVPSFAVEILVRSTPTSTHTRFGKNGEAPVPPTQRGKAPRDVNSIFDGPASSQAGKHAVVVIDDDDEVEVIGDSQSPAPPSRRSEAPTIVAPPVHRPPLPRPSDQVPMIPRAKTPPALTKGSKAKGAGGKKSREASKSKGEEIVVVD